MQVGDKLYCKKDYFTQERCVDYLNARRELVFKMRKGVIDMNQFHRTLDTLSDKYNDVTVKVLSEGEVYIVDEVILAEIRICGDNNNSVIIYNDTSEYNFNYGHYNVKMSEYFMSDKENRKEKLDRISDKAFLDFLRGQRKK